MTVQDYLRALREHWIIVLVGLLAALLGAAILWLVRPPQYTAQLTMYVSAQSVDTTQSAYQGGLLSQERVKSYVQLVSSPRVSQGVVQELNLASTPEAVAKQITASSAVDSVLIDVAVTDPSPQKATAIVNSVGRVFVRLVNELEQPVTPLAVPPVSVRVVQPATVPTAPSSPGLPITLAVGLVVGLTVGVGGALIRNALDTSVKSPEQLRDAANAPNLGTIAFDAAIPKHPLTVHEHPQSPRAEAFRQLRTNLQFVDVDNPRKVILVTSSVPSEGKTTTLTNLAIALASAGQRVLVIEADLRRPKLADLFGLERAVGLTSILAGRVRTQQAIQHWSGEVDVLASGPLPPNPSELLASRHMEDVLRELREQYDKVLIDSPPLLPVTDASAIAPATDGAILICRFKETTRTQVTMAVEALAAVSVPVLGTVFTMVPSNGPRAYAQQYNTYYRTTSPTAMVENATKTNQLTRPTPHRRAVPRGRTT